MTDAEECAPAKRSWIARYYPDYIAMLTDACGFLVGFVPRPRRNMCHGDIVWVLVICGLIIELLFAGVDAKPPQP